MPRAKATVTSAPARMTSEEYRALMAQAPAETKYHAVRTVVDGVTLDSKREANRYAELKLLETAGEIEALEVHPRFDLRVKRIIVGVYEADFRYFDKRMNRYVYVVEDVKGVRTAVYRLKKRLMEALYGIEVRET